MRTGDVIRLASSHLARLSGHEFDVLTVSRPVTPAAAVNLAKIISKLSPLVGNMIEFNTCEFLNDLTDFHSFGRWIRQDPGFPDTIFLGRVSPTPGFEIKAWFPLATEITARFKDSQRHFEQDQTHVAMLAWLPQYLIFGKPRIIDLVIVSAASVAAARDLHYHNPPDYVVLEPEDTSSRTRNLQQTNTNGYKWQGPTDPQDAERMEVEANRIVDSWGKGGRRYSTSPDYQKLLRTLLGQFKYRLDTNFAKMDRIVHPEIESFKKRVYATDFCGNSIGEWCRILSSGNAEAIGLRLARQFQIGDESERLVQG